MDIYIGLFLLSFANLALEVTLTRLLNVTTWYHLAFFAVSTALLGMTAGATTVYLKPEPFSSDKLKGSVAKASLGFALVVPVSLVILCITPVPLVKSIMSVFALLVATAACALPFYCSGIASSAIMTKSQLPIGKLYASDLIGASAGCLFVLGGLEILDAPSLILLCAAIAVLASLSFAWRQQTRLLNNFRMLFLLMLIVVVPLNSSTIYGIRPIMVKGRIESPSSYLTERWNSYSRIVVYAGEKRFPQYWGMSPKAPAAERIWQYHMNIDGDAGTVVRRFHSVEDINHLRFDVVNIAYYLRPKGGACIIGVGGGRDIQSALLFGHETVVGVEVNPIFIDLLRGQFRDFAAVAGHPGVSLIVDEARSYLSRTEQKYAVIQMSLTDTWAGTGAGAFSLSENALYTVEAWRVFFARLADDGIFTVSRWYSQSNVGETGRIVSLGVATLLQSGVTNPSQHIALVTVGEVSTLLVSKQPFSAEDVVKLSEVVTDLEFDPVILPGTSPTEEVLKSIVEADSPDALRKAAAGQALNYQPPTDESPYFFNMLLLGRIGFALSSDPGVVKGNLLSTLTLIALIVSLLFLTVITIVVPLMLKGRSGDTEKPKTFWPAAVYFSLIGAGFMFVEIALIQRLSVFLSHPVYALGILLFGIIASAGVGSLLSERLPLTRRPWIFLYPMVMSLAIILIRFGLPIPLAKMVTAPMLTKIIVSVLLIFPMGMLMGLFFPTGMRLAKAINAAETPWYWALNGIMGTLCSALTVFISIYWSISTSFYIAALCYALVLVCLYYMQGAVRASADSA